MNKITREIAPHDDSTKITFKPLQDLKFSYISKSHETSVNGQVSNELPVIKISSARKSNFLTKTAQYTNTINGALKMKLKIGQLCDEISLIDLKINEASAEFRKANVEHEHFTKSFEEFINRQYKTVKNSLAELETCENQTTILQNNLERLRKQLISKSLRIYELEEIWRRYKTSQNFVLHLSQLLKRDESVENFQNLQLQVKTLSLDELITNFKHLNNNNEEFNSIDYQHFTVKQIIEFLFKLKRQNLKMLRYKLHYQKLRNIFVETNNFLEENFNNSENSIKKNVSEIQIRNAKVVENLKTVGKRCKILGDKISTMKETTELHYLIENLYERCFKTNCIDKSHLHMIRAVEDYCHLLLCTLNSFGSSIN